VMACARTFLDMQKAYDKVWHAGLFWKLHKNGGITGKLWRIIHELYANSAHRSSKGRQQNCTESSGALLRAAPCHLHCSTCSLMI
jgi:hypothetical protein